MRTTTLALAASLAAAIALSLSGGALAQGATMSGATTSGAATPNGTDRTVNDPGRATSAAEKGTELTTGAVPAGNPTQDTTGAIGHPKSNNSNGATTAPAAR